MVRLTVVFLLVCSGQFSFGQLFPENSYPRDVFRNPLDIPIRLAANFGELRSNHYHMGLDIRTEHRENLPVFAAAEGYVYRIKIEPFGFGQAIYIRHANGYLSLYAHLNTFYPALAEWVKQKQYELERWDLTLEPPANLFPVKKGDLIAYSGNRGGSQGPHLHFEVRTFPDEINLNPLLFDLPVPDNIPPVIRSLAVYDRNRSFYEQSPSFIPVKGHGSHFETGLPVLILKTPNPGFGISGFDTQTGSRNPNGLFQGIVFEDGIAVSGFQMDRISYAETRGINAHIDYPTRQRGGPYYQLLFRLPGYHHSIYREGANRGQLHLEDGKLHEIRIELKDANGNISNLVFKARYQPEPTLSRDLPGKIFYPGTADRYESQNVAFYLGGNCLYDSLHIVYQELEPGGNEQVSAGYHFGNSEVPLADTMMVKIRLANAAVPKQRILMQWVDKTESEVKKPLWQDDWALASFRSFGEFRLLLDTVPPVISIPGMVENADLRAASRIQVRVRDNYKKIRSFRATLDGAWLLFTNDKEKAFVYQFDEKCKPGKHELKIDAEDEAGNHSLATFHFTR